MTDFAAAPRRVLLAVTGGIAAYKAPELVRALQQQGTEAAQSVPGSSIPGSSIPGSSIEVRCVMTRAAHHFVTPLTLSSLTGHRVATGLWQDIPEPTPAEPIEHIALAQWAELLLVAPATARTLARFAHGLADDLISTLYLATTAPVLVAPAMNVNMLAHPATQANLATLRARGVTVIEPGSGYLACGMRGGGRLAEIPAIVAAVQTALAAASTPTGALKVRLDLAAEHILITAGGTREPLDPVRFLGNRSSGKMGHALAAQALARGARVTLVTASPLPASAGCDVVRVNTAAEMHAAVLAALPQATAVIKSAAVADFRPATVRSGKLRRAAGPLTLALEPTPDIARAVVEHRRPGTLVVAFAAETENVLENAREKLLRKGVDAIVANDVSHPGLGFDSDSNAAVFLTRDRIVDLPETTKIHLAGRILDELSLLRAATPANLDAAHLNPPVPASIG